MLDDWLLSSLRGERGERVKAGILCPTIGWGLWIRISHCLSISHAYLRPLGKANSLKYLYSSEVTKVCFSFHLLRDLEHPTLTVQTATYPVPMSG